MKGKWGASGPSVILLAGLPQAGRHATFPKRPRSLTAASSLVAHQLRLPSCGGIVLREKLSLRFAASLSRLFRLPGSFAPPFLTGNLRSRELEPGFHSPLLSAVAPISDRSDAGRSQRGRSTDESRLRSPPSPRFAEC